MKNRKITILIFFIILVAIIASISILVINSKNYSKINFNNYLLKYNSKEWTVNKINKYGSNGEEGGGLTFIHQSGVYIGLTLQPNEGYPPNLGPSSIDENQAKLLKKYKELPNLLLLCGNTCIPFRDYKSSDNRYYEWQGEIFGLNGSFFIIGREDLSTLSNEDINIAIKLLKTINNAKKSN